MEEQDNRETEGQRSAHVKEERAALFGEEAREVAPTLLLNT
jgi:hypothetical protein